jgi:hypothetical protein
MYKSSREVFSRKYMTSSESNKRNQSNKRVGVVAEEGT